MSLIKLKEVNKVFHMGDADVYALSDINLTIGSGEFTSLLGPSGSGKTSLLNLMGLIDHPSRGDVSLMGTKINGQPDNEVAEIRNRTIGYIFQNFNLIEVLTALENVMFPLQIRGENERFARKAAMESLDAIGIGHLADRRPKQMSGGQQQRVAIARAIVTEPEIILADEPTANLDSVNSESIIQLMKELNIGKGITFVFSTHDPRLINGVSRKITMKDGQIVEDQLQ